MRAKLDYLLAIGLGIGIILAVFLAASVPVSLLAPRELEVVGILSPLMSNQWYIFKAREAPGRPVVEVRVKLNSWLSSATVVVWNYLDKKVRGTVSIYLYDGGLIEVAQGSARVEVASRQSVEIVIGLSWHAGFSPANATWGKLSAVFHHGPF